MNWAETKIKIVNYCKKRLIIHLVVKGNGKIIQHSNLIPRSEKTFFCKRLIEGFLLGNKMLSRTMNTWENPSRNVFDIFAYRRGFRQELV